MRRNFSFKNHLFVLILVLMLQLNKSSFLMKQKVHEICKSKECFCEKVSLVNSTYDITCVFDKASSSFDNESLKFESNHLIDIDHFLINLNNSSAHISNNFLNGLKINYLNIKGNVLTSFDVSDLSGLVSIKNLYLSNNNLKSNNFSSFGQNQNVVDTLESLYLRNNSLQSIPDLSSLHQLSYLDLSMNNIQEISAKSSFDFKLLSNLKTLDLSHNQLSFINFSYFSLEIKKSLEIFNLQSNNLTYLDYNFSKFRSLKDLSFSSNRLSEINVKFSRELINLNKLYLSHNQISSIRDDSFDYLVNLIQLDLSFNSLAHLNSNWFKRLKKLEKLLLESNKLKIIYLTSFKNLFNLELLDLSSNKINSFENVEESDEMKSLQMLQNLRVLRLSDNLLNEIKFNLIEILPALKKIYLHNNYLVNLPKLNAINNLTILDVSNQNSKLRFLTDHFLPVAMQFTNQHVFRLNISMNEDMKLLNKTFCPTTANNITISDHQRINKRYLYLYISYQTLASTDKCVFKQLSHSFKHTKIFLFNSKKLFLRKSQICDCNFRLFLSHFNITIEDDCRLYMHFCTLYNFNDDCIDKNEFKC